MANRKKIYIILFSLVVIVCLSGFVWSYFVTKDITDGKESKSGQVVSVKNLVLTETKEENIYWELYAVKGSYDSKTGDVILTDTTGNFYNEEKKVVLSFEADIGIYSEKTKTIILRGNTLVVAYDGSSIRSDEIIIKGRDEDIIANGNVIVTRNQDFISTADKARFNSELTFFEISGNTQTKAYSKENSGPKELVNRSEKS